MIKLRITCPHCEAKTIRVLTPQQYVDQALNKDEHFLRCSVCKGFHKFDLSEVTLPINSEKV